MKNLADYFVGDIVFRVPVDRMVREENENYLFAVRFESVYLLSGLKSLVAIFWGIKQYYRGIVRMEVQPRRANLVSV